jgi:hypothetical protein
MQENDNDKEEVVRFRLLQRTQCLLRKLWDIDKRIVN